jgi:hypothetical protein
MATTTDNIKFATSTAITCTLASLASSATVGRQSTVIDNSSNLYIDALVTIGIKTSASAMGSDKAVYIYVAGSEDGTNYDCDDAAIGATDASYTINNPSNLRLGAVINTLTSSKTYFRTFSVAALFGGVMPRKWALVVVNTSNQALDSTEGNHTKSYSGITYTNA